MGVDVPAVLQRKPYDQADGVARLGLGTLEEGVDGGHAAPDVGIATRGNLRTEGGRFHAIGQGANERRHAHGLARIRHGGAERREGAVGRLAERSVLRAREQT